MQQNLIDFSGLNITYSVGSVGILEKMQQTSAKESFADDMIEFLNDVSKKLLADRKAKAFPDVITLAFWMRAASLQNLKQRFVKEEKNIIKLGRGTIFVVVKLFCNICARYFYLNCPCK